MNFSIFRIHPAAWQIAIRKISKEQMMLVLSRRESEKILFPSLGITIEVVKIQGRRARLGINAPADIPVLRNECAVKKRVSEGVSSSRKTVEFTSDLFQTNQKLGDLIHIMRKRLSSAADTLNHLNQSVGETNDNASQRFMLDLFKELRSLESEAIGVLEESSVSVNNSAQVLLVQVDVGERTLLEGFLEISGFEVIIAGDGKDALEFLSMHSKPDVVLLDMAMPRIKGPEFVKNVHSNPNFNGMAIFAISDLSQAEAEQTHGVVDVDRWIQKPFVPKDLVREITGHLVGKKLVPNC